ncbi:UNVERIFIED_CONTAM: Tubulin polyglutamylase ttll5 [Siphonaria sp. JEL0065]|nr:Tubulin polyglutamylase ttll5 [Siphonaria sp. JEL0065]
MSTFLTEINDFGTTQSFADAMRRHQNKWSIKVSTPPTPPAHEEESELYDASDDSSIFITSSEAYNAETIANTQSNTFSGSSIGFTSEDYISYTNSAIKKRSEHGQSSMKSVRWKDFEDDPSETASVVESMADSNASTTALTTTSSSANTATTSFSSSSSSAQIIYLGTPLITWSAGPAAFGRVRFEQVNYLVSQKQAGKVRSISSIVLNPAFNTAAMKADAVSPEVLMKLSYKMSNGIEAGIVRATLVNCGFKECGPTQGDWNLFWSNGKMEPHEYRSLNKIVKPVNSTMMKGSQIIDSLAELPTRLKLDDRFLVQKYIDNPLKVNGCRFDLRVYVAVTSFNPLRVYMFQEGLVKYIKATEYKSDPVGQKTSLTAILRHISNQHGSSFSSLLMAKIKDIIVKTFLSGENAISTAAGMFVPHPSVVLFIGMEARNADYKNHRGNCFELLGFDLIIDANVTPWLVEVSTSPSLACDTPLDMEIKGGLVADLLTLIGMIPFQKHNKKTVQQVKPCRPPRGETPATVSKAEWSTSAFWENDKLTAEQQKLARIAKEENLRSGRFERIFPAENSAYIYSVFIPKNSPNWTLHITIFGKVSTTKPKHITDDMNTELEDLYSSSYSSIISSKAKQSQKYSTDLMKRKGKPSDETNVSNAPWAMEKEISSDSEEEGNSDGESLATAAEPSGEASIKKTTLQVSGTSPTGRESQATQKRNAETIGAKLQAREAFQVFLENIMGRLKLYSIQSTDKIDEEYIQQQVQILERFLKQANDLHVGDDQYVYATIE